MIKEDQRAENGAIPRVVLHKKTPFQQIPIPNYCMDVRKMQPMVQFSDVTEAVQTFTPHCEERKYLYSHTMFPSPENMLSNQLFTRCNIFIVHRGPLTSPTTHFSDSSYFRQSYPLCLHFPFLRQVISVWCSSHFSDISTPPTTHFSDN